MYDPNVWWSPLARISQQSGERDGDIRWFNTDLNGAPLEMTDADGSVRWSGDYGSFGAVNGQTQDSEGLRHGKPVESQPLRYAGQYADEETGLHYNLFRYYDPTVGRFTTQDPIGLAGGINLYQYAPNPLGWVDPLGLTPDEVIRYMGKDEAISSVAERNGLGGLVPNNRGDKAVWVNHDSKPGFNPGNEKYRAVMTVDNNGVDMLNKHQDISAVNYKETGLKDGVLSKQNEPKARGIGRNVIDKFNNSIKSFRIEKKGKDGKWKSCGKKVT